MRRRALWIVWCVIFIHMPLSVPAAERLLVVTESSAPLQYRQEGELKGVAVDIVRRVLDQASVPYRMVMMPWARAYQTATTQPDVLIFSIARTPEREPLFHWVGPIVPIEYGLYALRSRHDIHVMRLDDARRYRIGVTNQDVRHKYLLSQGFEEGESHGLYPVADQTLSYKMLFAGRIDLIVMGSMTCLTDRIDCSKLRKVYSLTDISRGLYMAFSKASRADWRGKVEQAFETLKSSGALDKLQAPLRQ